MVNSKIILILHNMHSGNQICIEKTKLLTISKITLFFQKPSTVRGFYLFNQMKKFIFISLFKNLQELYLNCMI